MGNKTEELNGNLLVLIGQIKEYIRGDREFKAEQMELNRKQTEINQKLGERTASLGSKVRLLTTLIILILGGLLGVNIWQSLAK